MTRQEMFNKSYTCLMKQGRRAYDSTQNRCVHESPTGERCAVGWLVDDPKARYAMDAHYNGLESSTGIAELPLEIIPEYLRDELSFLESIQNVHDYTEVAGTENFRAYITRGYRIVAAEYDLDDSVTRGGS